MKTSTTVGLIALAAAIIFVYTQLTIFIIPPIGLIPQGRTLLIWRLESLNFIDSPEGWCEREMGGVSLLCRGAVLGRVADARILLNLPYGETLHRWSTGGRSYSR